jgi:hypothetical protein
MYMEMNNSDGIEPADTRDEFVDDIYMEGFGRTVKNGNDIRKRIQGEKDDSPVIQLLRDLYKVKPRILPNKYSDKSLESIKDRFPNFLEPIERFDLQLKLCSLRGAKRFTAPNMLLVGPPGIGKTYFMKELCAALGVSFQSISMSLASEGFYLTGLQRGYGTSTPGQLAKAMAKSKCINPFILLDEIEKSCWRGNDGRKGVENPILQMFERGSAGEVEDLCLETSLDLSEVTYICTANSIDGIPEPILSRMTVFNIPRAEGSMLQRIAESVLNEAVVEDLGITGVRVFVTPDVAEVFNDVVSPRTIRNAAASIMAPQLIAFPGRDEIHICADDIIPHMPSMPLLEVVEEARSIGFHANV